MKISLIIPLFDRRDAGCAALETALRQSADRGSYEVIAVVGDARPSTTTGDRREQALLLECDVVVELPGEMTRPDQEIPMLLAGYARSTGDVLFFMEGHTVLDADCCAMIAAHFRDNPGSRIAWAPRIHRNETALGSLIERHSKHHERLARERGGFWLGANSAVARDLFEEMGRLDANYLRFSERVFLERVVRAGVAIGRLPSPLATHHDDMTLPQFLAVADAAGEGRFRYYNASAPGATTVRVRHWIYVVANREANAIVLRPFARGVGTTLLRAAVGLHKFNAGWAYRVFVLGLGFADLAGYCTARVRAGHSERNARWTLASGRGK